MSRPDALTLFLYFGKFVGSQIAIMRPAWLADMLDRRHRDIGKTLAARPLTVWYGERTEPVRAKTMAGYRCHQQNTDTM